jgi:hypothetical protein
MTFASCPFTTETVVVLPEPPARTSTKVSGDKSMPGNQRPGPGVRNGALGAA